MQRRVVLTLALVLGCAPTAEIDESETTITPGPVAQFNPAGGVIPLPNNLIVNPATGKVNAPASCGETATATATRTGIINTLNGFGTWKTVLQVSFDEAVDLDSIEDKIFLFKLVDEGTAQNPASAVPVPIVVVAGVTTRFPQPLPDCGTPVQVPVLQIVPMVPLSDDATYGVVLLDGIESAGGAEFGASSTWAFVRQEENPVEVQCDAAVENGKTTYSIVSITKNNTPLDPSDSVDVQSICGIDLLWKAHAGLLSFVTPVVGGVVGRAVTRDDILLAWSFNTQTIVEPLDPQELTGPAATVDTATSNSVQGLADLILPGQTVAFPAKNTIQEALCAATGQAAGCNTICAGDGGGGSIPCSAVGAVKMGAILSPNYQVSTPFPFNPTVNTPGPWSDPVNPSKQNDALIPLIAFVPAGAVPTNGWPVVIFGHGLGRTKSDLFVIASQLAGAGFASVAIDWVAHGDRAVQVFSQNMGGVQCAGDPTASANPECFAPIFTANLAITRDNVRQSVIDVLKLVEVLKTCATEDCDELVVDADHINYLGQSLGALIGNMIVAVSPDIGVGVMNVGGVSWGDVLTETPNLDIRCNLIDSLILAGVLQGDTRVSGSQNALCLGTEWKTDPAFLSFLNTLRWVVDPAEGANFAELLGASGDKVLIQQVDDDQVVPNVSTQTLAALLSLAPVESSFNTGTAAPTAAAAGTASAFITYDTEEVSGVQNAYAHGSLLSPAGGAVPGFLGTAQMQTDAITYLVINGK